MPTYLHRPVTRETSFLMRTSRGSRPLVVQLGKDGVYLRAKGTRTTYLLPYGFAVVQAAKLVADAKRAQKRRKKER